MAPKKAQTEPAAPKETKPAKDHRPNTNNAKQPKTKHDDKNNSAGQDDKEKEATHKGIADAKTGDKRKQPPSSSSLTKETTQAKKEARTGERKSARSASSAAKVSVNVPRLINFLLSPEALALARPPDEKDAHSSEQTYTSTVPMSPFEELLSACILSRPISHRLGERSIRTIFNGDYKFRNPKAVRDAGAEKRLQAFYDAKTQHKDKTAEQIGNLADIVIEQYADGAEDTSLEKLRKEGDGDVDKLAEVISKQIKGVGKTAIEIFFRRVQAHWAELYPYVDHRTKAALNKLGLPEDASDLRDLIKEHWKDIDISKIGGKDELAKERIVFVRVLERATGTDLEGHSPDKVMEHVR